MAGGPCIHIFIAAVITVELHCLQGSLAARPLLGLLATAAVSGVPLQPVLIDIGQRGEDIRSLMLRAGMVVLHQDPSVGLRQRKHLGMGTGAGAGSEVTVEGLHARG